MPMMKMRMSPIPRYEMLLSTLTYFVIPVHKTSVFRSRNWEIRALCSRRSAAKSGTSDDGIIIYAVVPNDSSNIFFNLKFLRG